jgi:excisionase family DNA binding protein
MTKTSTLIERPGDDSQAKQARRTLEAFRKGASITGEAAPPPAAAAAMERVLEAIAGGDGVAIVPLDAEITTQEAADLLGIARPALIGLLETGVIPHRTIDAQRRIKSSDVLAYRDRRRIEQNAMLDEMVAENQRLGLYDRE